MKYCFIVQILPVTWLFSMFWQLAVLLPSVYVSCIVNRIIQTLPPSPTPQMASKHWLENELVDIYIYIHNIYLYIFFFVLASLH